MGMKQEIELPPATDNGAPLYFANGMLPVQHVGNGNLLFSYTLQECSAGTPRRGVEVKVVIHMNIIAALRRQTDALIGALIKDALPEHATVM